MEELLKKLDVLEKRVEVLTTIVKELVPDNVPNKDGIPIGTRIYGDANEVGKIELEVLPKSYMVKKIAAETIAGGRRFKSLSAAAEAFSQIKRKSGWIFWHDKNGKTLKEAYKG